MKDQKRGPGRPSRERQEAEFIELQTRPGGLWFKVYIDMLKCGILSHKQLAVYLALLSFLPVGQQSGTCYPSISSIAKRAGYGQRSVQEALKELDELGAISKKRRGLTKSNMYIVNDCAELWDKSITAEQRRAMVETEAAKLTTAELLEELQRRGIDTTSAEAPPAPAEKAKTERTEKPEAGTERTTGIQNGGYYDKAEEVKEDLNNARRYYTESVMTDVENAIDIINEFINTDSAEPVELRRGESTNRDLIKAVFYKLSLIQIIAAVQNTRALGAEIKDYKKLMLRNLYNARAINEQQIIDVKHRTQRRKTEAEE